MQDKIIEWLEENMNKNGLCYFKQNKYVPARIDCYFKENDIKFCTFYRDVIEWFLSED